MDNLLEKLINQKEIEELSRLNAVNIVNTLFADLLDRERDILSRRFGLSGNKGETLEKIGTLHKLTRERVRQIEAASIKKIKNLDTLEDSVNSLKKIVRALLHDHGGVASREYLLDILTVISLELNDELLSSSQKKTNSENEQEINRRIYRNHFNFLLSRLMGNDLELLKESDKFQAAFIAKGEDSSPLEELAKDLLEKVDNLKKVFTTKELLDLLKSLEAYNKYQIESKTKSGADISKIFKSKVFSDSADLINNNKILYSLMQAIKNLKQNKYGEWGISNWPEITPKTVDDKIYLILKHSDHPLHFTKIAKEINEMKFDKKIANPATVHNELILDNRYVLVSRGTYGLRDRQY